MNFCTICGAPIVEAQGMGVWVHRDAVQGFPPHPAERGIDVATMQLGPESNGHPREKLDRGPEEIARAVHALVVLLRLEREGITHEGITLAGLKALEEMLLDTIEAR